MTDVIEAGNHQTVEELIRAAHKYLDETGDVISPSKVSKLIRKFHRESASGVTFESWAWVYADPTGIAAGKRVDRERASKTTSVNEKAASATNADGQESTNRNH